MCMKAPKIQAPPPAPVTPQETIDTSANAARDRERRRRAAMTGRNSTILTADTAAAPSPAGKTLLGS